MTNYVGLYRSETKFRIQTNTFVYALPGYETLKFKVSHLSRNIEMRANICNLQPNLLQVRSRSFSVVSTFQYAALCQWQAKYILPTMPL